MLTKAAFILEKYSKIVILWNIITIQNILKFNLLLGWKIYISAIYFNWLIN